MKLTPRALLALVALGTAASLPAAPARACTCIGKAGDFLVESGAEFPRNAAGFPWVGPLARRDKWIPPAKQMFRLQQVAPGKPREVPFYLEFESEGVPDSSISHSPPPIVIVRPRLPFVPGARYRLTFRPTKAALKGINISRMSLEPKQVEYTVGEQDLSATPSEPSSLILGKLSKGELEVFTRCGSCLTTIVAAQQRVEFELPPSARRWRSTLLYAMAVDGAGWRPMTSYCSDVPHGRGWVTTGEELLFSRCSLPTPDDGCMPDQDIANGTHDVEMTAWLAGTPLAFTARAKVTLACK